MPELRDLVRARLIGDGTRPWGDRVVEIEAATAQEEYPPVGTLPFLMVKATTDDPGVLVGDDVTNIEVWPHAQDSTWAVLDALVGQIIPLLTAVLVDPGGRAWLLGYAGSPTQDTPVRSWGAYARPLRFRALLLNWVRPLDQCAQALADHTKAAWPVLQVDPLTWQPSDSAPGVYYEPIDGPEVNLDLSTLTSDLYNEVLLARIIAPSATVRQDWVETLALGLPRTNPVLGTGRMQLMVGQVRPQADPYRDGQLRVTCTYDAGFVQDLPGSVWDDNNAPEVGAPLRHLTLRDEADLTLVVPQPPP